MKKAFILVSSYILFNICVSITYGSVAINEIMYNPDQCSDSFCELVEIYNTGDDPVNLSGWTLCGNALLPGYVEHADSLAYLDSGMNISGKGFALITDGGSGTDVYHNFDVNSSTSSLHVGSSSLCGGLSNTKDTVYINDSSGIEVDAVTYENSWGGNGNNRSLERIDPAGNSNSSNNWSEGKINGTPGYRNSASPSDHDIAVYESDIISDPTDPSPRTGVNISFLIRNIGLNNENNVNASLYNASGSELSMIHSELMNITKQSSANITVKWNNTARIISNMIVRIEGSDDNTTNNNASKSISFDFHLVINEIMYNPPAEIGGDTDFEWSEIYNNATYEENLTGWHLVCDSKSKSLKGTLEPGGYLVLAKDTKQFYTYYSSSIKSDSQSCSLNNDGDTIKLVFNDSAIYHEEIAQYSNSWGADGTGYSLEKINPLDGNNADNWGESKAHGGTPGVNNNPGSAIKNSLANPNPAVIYRTVTESVYVNNTGETANYQIISFPSELHVGEQFKVIVSLKSPTLQNMKLYSYAYDGKNLISEGFDGVNWKARWDANIKNIQVGPSQNNVELENRIKADTLPGKYKFKVRIKDEIDLTRDIEVLAKKLENVDKTADEVFKDVIINCERIEDSVLVSAGGQSAKSISMMHFSKDPTRNETLKGNLTVALSEGYNSIIFIENDRILKTCDYSFQEQSLITGRTVKVNSIDRIISKIKEWIKGLVS